MADGNPIDPDRQLGFERLLDAPADKLYRCWTDTTLIPKWFCPPPWRATRAVFDVRPGGSSSVFMQGPEGQTHESHGLFLEVEPNRRLVFTDAFTSAWRPSSRAFMVADLRFEDQGDGKTLYRVRIDHWSPEAREEHEKMGFHPGWDIATDQLEALAKTL